MKEKDIERRVCKYARDTYRMLTPKFTSPSNAGVPDRMFITLEGVIAFVEFKAPGQKLTPLQVRKAAELDEHRCDVFVVDDVENGKKLVDGMSNPELWMQVLGYKEPEDDTPAFILPSRVSSSRH